MKLIHIGTRSSPLALAQTQEAIDALEAHHPTLRGMVKIVPLRTTGDTILDRSLADIGGKSLFTTEIERALLEKEIDLAVHSMKDVTAHVREGLVFAALLKRGDPRDALITHGGTGLEELAPGALFGTSSLRRRAYILHKYSHLKVISMRGNVCTRLQKIATGDVDSTLLAVAGLTRLGQLDRATKILEIEDCLPAIAQGAIGIQCRAYDQDMLRLLEPLNHLPTFQVVSAERSFMRALNGSCRTPMAAYGYIDGDTLFLKGMISEPDGQAMQFVTHQGPVSRASILGIEAAYKLREPQ